MNRHSKVLLILLPIVLLVLASYAASSLEYPFLDTKLSDDERLDNLISLMTLDEKLSHLSPMLPGIPRLGVKGTRIVEGLHGLALSGPANWAVKGKGEAPTTTFPQAIGLAQMWDPELQQKIAGWEAYETRYLTQNKDYGSAGLIVLAPNADLTEAATASIKAGITMFLDQYKQFVEEAMKKGSLSEKEIDEAVRGNLRVMLKLGLMDRSADNPYASIGIDDTAKPWLKPEAAELARKATVESIVLMKNNGLLPFKKEKLKSIAVIGPSADLVISDWYAGTPPYKVSILEGIRNAVGKDVQVRFAPDNKADAAIIAARESDVAIICVGNHPTGYGLEWGKNHVASDGREEVDRQAISLEQEDLVRLVKAANPKTVLAIVSSFPYAIPWSKANIPAILHVTQSSQELGSGVADVLFGKASPAGRLVQTWSASIENLRPMLDYNIRNGRTYMYDQQAPLFAFGHGLSYTTFEYSDLKVDRTSIEDKETAAVSLQLKNTGSMDSDEVVQLYIQFPGSKVARPAKALKGFKRVHVPAGKSITVTLPLKAEDLKYWNEKQHSFVLEPGEARLMIGAASDDIRLNGKLMVQ